MEKRGLFLIISIEKVKLNLKLIRSDVSWAQPREKRIDLVDKTSRVVCMYLSHGASFDSLNTAD